MAVSVTFERNMKISGTLVISYFWKGAPWEIFDTCNNLHFNTNLKVCAHFAAILLLFIGPTASLLPVSHCYFLADWFNLHLPLLMRCITVDLICHCSWPRVINLYQDFCDINCWESFGYKLPYSRTKNMEATTRNLRAPSVTIFFHLLFITTRALSTWLAIFAWTTICQNVFTTMCTKGHFHQFSLFHWPMALADYAGRDVVFFQVA